MKLMHLASIPVLAFLAASAHGQDVLVHRPDVTLLDPATLVSRGVVVLPGLNVLQSLSYAGQGVFFGLTGFPSSVSVVRIDLRDPSVSVLGPTNIPWTEAACAVDRTTGSVYVLGTPQSGFPPANLYTVDPTTGGLTFLATTTSSSIPPRTFTIDENGQGYGMGGYGTSPQLPFHPRLWTIDLATGQAAVLASFDSVNLPPGTQYQSIAVRADGSVWLATDHGLWRLDPATLTGTLLDSWFWEKIAFAPASEIGLGYVEGCRGNSSICPCVGFVGSNGNGCSNSTVPQGGNLRAFGVARLSNDTLRLVAANLSNSTGLFFQGNASHAPAAFGEGLRCVGGTIRRLGGGVITSNAFSYPRGSQLPVSVQGQIAVPGTFHYQALYRDSATYCNGTAFDLTNSISVNWTP